MEAQLSLLPVECIKCGKVFDLRYDEEYMGDLREENILELLKGEKVFTCWRCKHSEMSE